MNLNNLSCIDLDQPALEGFRQFVSCWLYQSEPLTFIVDPGPLSTIPHLLNKLREKDVRQLDYILLTHIHIDHAGGTGELLKSFPAAQVICHPQGIKHLINPEKLWQGSQKVLGKLAEVYGEIIPVPEKNISFSETIGESGLHVYQTPGHAQHHCCYLFGDLLFGGEVAGVHCEVKKGVYMRPATPPRFILEVAVDSLQRMIELQPRYLVIGHHGLVEPAVDHLRTALNQLKLWVKGIAELLEQQEEINEDAFHQWLLENDLNYRNFEKLPEDIQARERYFLGNSFRGMYEYVTSLSERERILLMSACLQCNQPVHLHLA